MPIKWSYGVTTIPSRQTTLLPTTLNSLWHAGFREPRLFIDGVHHRKLEEYDRLFHLPMTPHYPTVLPYKNWFMGLQELYLRDFDADRFAIFQDDMVAYKNLRQYLEAIPYPQRGYLNLYTFPHNEALVPRDQYQSPMTGWYPSNQKGLGAVALVFNNEAVRILLTSRHMVDRVHTPYRGDRAIDGAVVQALMNVQWPEYVHYPTLVQHIGLVTTMGTPNHRPPETFQGEDFDAMSLLPRSQVHCRPIPPISIQLK